MKPRRVFCSVATRYPRSVSGSVERHTAITARAAKGYTEVELNRFSGHTSLRSLEVYIAYNRESAKYKAREWERRGHADL